jgi:hypothetical protein
MIKAVYLFIEILLTLEALNFRDMPKFLQEIWVPYKLWVRYQRHWNNQTKNTST